MSESVKSATLLSPFTMRRKSDGVVVEVREIQEGGWHKIGTRMTDLPNAGYVVTDEDGENHFHRTIFDLKTFYIFCTDDGS